MAHGWDGDADRHLCGIGRDLRADVLYRLLGMEFADMTKLDALRILKLLSALESWAYSTKNPLPASISDDLLTANAVLEQMVLKENT
jgi:hypothetical protein